MCVGLSTTILALHAKTRLMSDINGLVLEALEKRNGDFPETAAFKLEKLAVSLTKLPSLTHQSMLYMRIYTLTASGTVKTRATSWRLL